jgi:hypothetical protein
MSASSLSVLDSTGTAKTLGTFTDAAGVQRYQTSGDSSIAHYSAGTSRFAMVATPTAAFILPGNATTTVRVKKITLSGAATSAGSMKFSIKKNSDAGTVGSAVLTALTSVPHDSTAAGASSAVSSVGTANYTTVPALVGTVYSGELEMGVLATGVFNPVVVEYGTGGRQAIVLRGVAQSLTIDFLGGAIPSGGVVDVAIEWAEDAS